MEASASGSGEQERSQTTPEDQQERRRELLAAFVAIRHLVDTITAALPLDELSDRFVTSLLKLRARVEDLLPRLKLEEQELKAMVAKANAKRLKKKKRRALLAEIEVDTIERQLQSIAENESSLESTSDDPLGLRTLHSLLFPVKFAVRALIRTIPAPVPGSEALASPMDGPADLPHVPMPPVVMRSAPSPLAVPARLAVRPPARDLSERDPTRILVQEGNVEADTAGHDGKKKRKKRKTKKSKTKPADAEVAVEDPSSDSGDESGVDRDDQQVLNLLEDMKEELVIYYLRAQGEHAAPAEQDRYHDWVGQYARTLADHICPAVPRFDAVRSVSNLLKYHSQASQEERDRARHPFTLLWALSERVESDILLSLWPDAILAEVGMKEVDIRKIARNATRMFAFALQQHNSLPVPPMGEARSRHEANGRWIRLSLLQHGATMARREILPSLRDGAVPGEEMSTAERAAYIEEVLGHGHALHQEGFARAEVSGLRLDLLNQRIDLHLNHPDTEEAREAAVNDRHGHALVVEYLKASRKLWGHSGTTHALMHACGSLDAYGRCLVYHQVKIPVAMRQWEKVLVLLDILLERLQTDESADEDRTHWAGRQKRIQFMLDTANNIEAQARAKQAEQE